MMLNYMYRCQLSNAKLTQSRAKDIFVCSVLNSVHNAYVICGSATCRLALESVFPWKLGVWLNLITYLLTYLLNYM